MTGAATLERLRHALRGPLPGHDAFLELSGYRRAAPKAGEPPPRESAVLALIYPKQGALHTLLMLRPEYDGVHGGQVGFPGGKHEERDPSLEHTALREFREETGARHAGIEVLGTLTPVHIPPSRSLVTPYVGHTPAIGELAPDPREVAELIEAPLDLLLRDDILTRRTRYVQTLGRSVEVPCFDVLGHAVWGATALMVAELRELLRKTD